MCKVYGITMCAVSGDAQYVCSVQCQVADPVQRTIGQNNHHTKNQNHSCLTQSGPNSLHNFQSTQNF